MHLTHEIHLEVLEQLNRNAGHAAEDAEHLTGAVYLVGEKICVHLWAIAEAILETKGKD